MASRPSGASSDAATDRILRDLGQFQITSDRPRLSAEEEEVLRLYEEIEDVRLRRAVIEAASEVSKGTSSSTTTTTAAPQTEEKLQQELKKAEREMVEARLVYLIRQHVVEDVLTLDPVLKAVHADPGAAGGGVSGRQADLRSLIDQRDVLSMAQGNAAERVRETQRRLLDAQVRSIKTVEANQRMAHDLRTIAGELRRTDLDNVVDRQLKDDLQSVEADLAHARKRRQLIKGVVSALVAGSGVDWAQDDRLLGLVLEEDT